MSEKQLENVDFDMIRYANCWEDPDVLLPVIEGDSGAKYMSIASAGDNSFSLLVKDPDIVVAVDVSKTQLYLVELKALAIRELDYDDFVGLLGFTELQSRLEVFNSIKSQLSNEARAYWEANIDHIEDGIIYKGKFENFFKIYRSRMLPFVHGKAKIREFFEEKSDQEQEAFYDDKWDSWRWRLLFQMLFNKFIFGKYGRDPEFLKYVETTVPTYLLGKTREHFITKYSQTNHFLEFIMLGKFKTFLPHYARPEHFEKIKANISRLVIFEGLLDEALKEHKGVSFFNLSNIFEYMDIPLFKQVVENLLDNSADDAKFSYWNLMINRRFVDVFPDRIEHQDELSKRLNKVDKGYFYNYYVVDQKK